MNHDFQSIETRSNITSRGGGFEISLDHYGFPGHRMATYQNYLGGGLLGRVVVTDTVRKSRACTQPEHDLLDSVGEALKRHFHSLTNPDTEWEDRSYDQNQYMPESGY